MKKRLLYLVLPIITLILEILPFGAVCNFARPADDGTIGRFRELYSYFDLVPFGYANFAPFITALITCIILIFLGVYCITGKRSLMTVTRIVLFINVIISLCPLLLGISFFSIVGALISLTLLAEFLLLFFNIKSPKM